MKKFFSKILLFGEHTINKDSYALAIPFKSYFSLLSFKKTTNTIENSKKILEIIYHQIESQSSIKSTFDLKAFRADLDKNLWINMNIPIGYGLGSSGAICAAIFERYTLDKNKGVQELKTILGLMEGAFHGKSSGLDPLVSYFAQPVYVRPSNIDVLNFDIKQVDSFGIFLLDTRKARKTGPLVNAFLNRFDNNVLFRQIVNERIIPLTRQIILDIICNKGLETYDKIEEISRLQLEHFKFLILDKHIEIWKKSLNNKDFFLKICGAGGGGFMLGFYQDKEKVLRAFRKDDIHFI